MARIPIYHTQVDPQVGSSGRYVSANQDIARGLSRLGQSLRTMGETFARQEERDAIFQVRKDMSQQRMQWSETLAQRKEEAEPGAANFSQTLLDEYEPAMESCGKRESISRSALHALEESQLEFRERLGIQAQSLKSQAVQRKSVLMRKRCEMTPHDSFIMTVPVCL